MERLQKTEYYLSIAKEVAKRSTCLRSCYGAVIVKNDEIRSTGYNGAPRGRKNCLDCGYCVRTELGIPKGNRYELCRSVHAESNAIISASRNDMINATLYLSGFNPDGTEISRIDCCIMCKRLIINAGIKNVIFDKCVDSDIRKIDVNSWILIDDVIIPKSQFISKLKKNVINLDKSSILKTNIILNASQLLNKLPNEISNKFNTFRLSTDNDTVRRYINLYDKYLFSIGEDDIKGQLSMINYELVMYIVNNIESFVNDIYKTCDVETIQSITNLLYINNN